MEKQNHIDSNLDKSPLPLEDNFTARHGLSNMATTTVLKQLPHLTPICLKQATSAYDSSEIK